VVDHWIDNDRYAHLAAVQNEQQIPEYRNRCADRTSRSGWYLRW
jgi:hypothetical protein